MAFLTLSCGNRKSLPWQSIREHSLYTSLIIFVTSSGLVPTAFARVNTSVHGPKEDARYSICRCGSFSASSRFLTASPNVIGTAPMSPERSTPSRNSTAPLEAMDLTDSTAIRGFPRLLFTTLSTTFFGNVSWNLPATALAVSSAESPPNSTLRHSPSSERFEMKSLMFERPSSSTMTSSLHRVQMNRGPSRSPDRIK